MVPAARAISGKVTPRNRRAGRRRPTGSGGDNGPTRCGCNSSEAIPIADCEIADESAWADRARGASDRTKLASRLSTLLPNMGKTSKYDVCSEDYRKTCQPSRWRAKKQ